MLKKLKVFIISAGVAIAALSLPAQAVPFIIIDEDHGTCLLQGENEFNYIYLCKNGATLFIRKNTGGGGGGPGGSGDDPIVP
jgi:hypothetical protein